ncbi:hypothetical protein HNQ91_005907 [Filimonas zeae]|uniref:GLPGLI family protein n=1 Tax=Filimonas zeae TaxID=1737353 RepID=A0A917J797_9BACT|nr:hypothetical protein [Filimonas zeae]MDR6342820.1 hypothetical protein [Filimonas zeae]GGH82829.1 hypothetical protein GCM10011379_57300 [Filimonas zeae]
MRVSCIIIILLIVSWCAKAQDTTVYIDKHAFTLQEVVVRNNMDYKGLLERIKNDTTFYKAFRNLRIIEFAALNDIVMLDKNDKVKASYFSKTKQHRADGCRTTEVQELQTTGDFLDNDSNFNYLTGQMYGSLFLTKGRICGENNIVKGGSITTEGKSGMEKHKEQLKMLFFNPGKKIPGIPFIGNKLDLYDNRAHKLYDYRLDYSEYKGRYAYVFSIKPKENLGMFREDDIVVDNMTTWFDATTMEVMARNYSLSYKAGVYDFDVNMEVEMSKIGDLLVPSVLRYKGNFGVILKKRERARFTATLFDFKS